MKEIALITLHGMGPRKDGYYLGLEDGLKKRLGKEWTRISFQNIDYSPLLQDPQDELWEKIATTRENDVDSIKLRKFFLFGFGDAGSIEYSAHRDGKKYIEVQKEIQRALLEAYRDLEKDHTRPVVIIAQSLGCQVISNYLWDSQYEKFIFENTSGMDGNQLDFLKLKSLHNLFTTGCNIPLFISGISNRKCFKKPNSRFKWDNFYDADDVLGWPLRQLGSTFKIVDDHPINAGGLFTSWNWASHGKYWTDQDVLRPLANVLLNHLANSR